MKTGGLTQGQLNRLFKPAKLPSPVVQLIQFFTKRLSVKIVLGIIVAAIWLLTLTGRLFIDDDNLNLPIELASIADGVIVEPIQGQDGVLQGAYNLAQRRLPLADIAKVRFNLVLPDGSEEFFKWQVSENRSVVTIQATTLSSLTTGLAHFYRTYCSIELLSWADASRPKRTCFASTDGPLQGESTAKFPLRYGWNAVTFSYSSTFWDWPRYERELDWLALRGVNLLLAHEGQEYLFRRVFREFAATADEVEAFFTHQVYLAWNRMGNIHKVSGPANATYIEDRYWLQHKILARMQQLGMSPVLPAFNGYVPKMSSKAGTSTCYLKLWSGFPESMSSVCRLSPQSALFTRIAERVVDLQLRLYGRYLSANKAAVVYFSSDTYNENPVQEGEEDMFQTLATSIYDPPSRVAVKHGFKLRLVMQMWFLANDWRFWTKARAMKLLEAFPHGSLVLLDLHAEKRAQLDRLELTQDWTARTGHALIWCVLHNFGGGGGIGGEVVKTFKNIARVTRLLQVSNGGIGFAPEALEQNELVYDSVLAQAWTTDLSFTAQFHQWVYSRYRTHPPPQGNTSHQHSIEYAIKSWNLVLKTAMARPEYLAGYGPPKSVWEIRPIPGLIAHGQFMPTLFHYDARTFITCTRRLMLALRDCSYSRALQHDLVDFARQMLSDEAMMISRRLERHHFHDTPQEFNAAKREMLDLLGLVGDLLTSPQDDAFCFQDRLDAFSERDMRYRRQLVTVWNEHNDGTLADYASLQRGGNLFYQVHLERWKLLLNSFDLSSYQLERKFLAIELRWTNGENGELDECNTGRSRNVNELIDVVWRTLQFAKRNVVGLPMLQGGEEAAEKD